jgi:diguanylate cyclase (GGDEF)-like protein
MNTRRRLRYALLVLAFYAGSLGATEPAPPRNAFEERVDTIAREGFERPGQALAALTQLQASHADSIEERRVILQAMAGIEAASGAATRANALAEQLLALAPNDASGRAGAGATLVRAQVAENAGRTDLAAPLVQAALAVFQSGCPLAGGSASPADATGCDYRSTWGALHMLERDARSRGVPATAEIHAKAALALAEWAGDTWRESASLISLAVLAQGRAEDDSAQRLLARARHLAMLNKDLAQQARVYAGEGQVASLLGQRSRALRAHEAGLALAVQANAPRLQAQLLIDLGDTYARLGRPGDALRAAERALVIVRQNHDVRSERVLIGRTGLAKIGLGRVAEGKQDLARALEFWQQGGQTGQQADTLLEFGEALASAGDASGALELYHRERTLSADLMQVNRGIELQELQSRNDAKARERDIELLSGDNSLKSAALANRDLQQRIWWLLAAVMLLAIALAAILYRRVRGAHLRLAAGQVQLQAQSERDPLTNLANRRHFHAVMARLCGVGRGFEGALMMVDLDHFKHVNDRHGHAAGDQVLVEVARRLHQAVRSDDLIVRWGGEEFLVLAPHAANEQAKQMAARVLRLLADAPVHVGAGPDARELRVTASIGYARFPLPLCAATVPWEEAVVLVDMALYTAKDQGRNRAVGIVSSTAATAEALRDVQANFDTAWHDGRITLLQTVGPESRGEVNTLALA